MASAPQLELQKQEGVPVSEDGTIGGHQAEKAKTTLKEQESGALLHESTTTQNVTPGQNLLGHQDSAQPGIRPGDVAGKAVETKTMPQCFDPQQNQYIYCSSNFSTYIAIGIVLPLGLLFLTLLVSGYLRYKRRRELREQQQIGMTSVVSIDNQDVDIQQAPYTYSYPPHYASIDNSNNDKPPSYEQTVQHLNETNVTSAEGAAVLPITTIDPSSSSSSTHPQSTAITRNET